MVLDGVLRVLDGMNVVAVREMCVVGGLFVIAGFVMLGSFVVVARSVLQMFCCLLVVMSCFLGHGQPLHDLKAGFFSPQGLSEADVRTGVNAERIQDEYSCAGLSGRKSLCSDSVLSVSDSPRLRMAGCRTGCEGHTMPSEIVYPKE